VAGIPSLSSQARKRNKRHPNQKGGSKIIYLQMTQSYIENPKKSHEKTFRIAIPL